MHSLKGSTRKYSEVTNVEDLIFMYELYGDCTECDGDKHQATSYVNLNIDFIPGDTGL